MYDMYNRYTQIQNRLHLQALKLLNESVSTVKAIREDEVNLTAQVLYLLSTTASDFGDISVQLEISEV